MKWKVFLLFGLIAGVASFAYPLYRNRPVTVTIPLVSDGIQLAYGQVVIGDETGKIISPPKEESTKDEDKMASLRNSWGPLILGYWVGKKDALTVTLPPGRYTVNFWGGDVCEGQDCVLLGDKGIQPWSEFVVHPGQEVILAINAEEVDRRAREAFADEARWIDEYYEQRELERERLKNDPYAFPYSTDLLDPCTEQVCAANEACFNLMGLESCIARCDGEYTGPCVKGWCKPFSDEAPYDFAVCETEDDTEDG